MSIEISPPAEAALDAELTFHLTSGTKFQKQQRRRQIDPSTCEREYSDPEVEFMRAMDLYKRRSGRMFPTCSEILEVVRSLGYVKKDAETPEFVESAEPAEMAETAYW